VATPLTGYRGLDYAEDLVLLEKGVPLSGDQLNAISRVSIRLANGTAIDSDEEPGVFDWPIDTEWEKRPAKGLRINLRETTLPAGKYEGLLIVYDPDHPHGLPWSDVTVGIKSP
jgi:hypothetical protein